MTNQENDFFCYWGKDIDAQKPYFKVSVYSIYNFS